jgi:hypothetical protein
MRFENFCSPETLINFDFGKRSFILCDCEGYEFDLFTEEVIEKLTNCDLIIELHDKINPLISSTLIKRFEKTHYQQILETQDRNFEDYPELNDFSTLEKKILISEGRGGLLAFQKMQWLYLKAK